MSKPRDQGEETQPLSDSQVVSVTKKPPIPPGDQSVAWRGNVVGLDEFSTAPKKRGRAKWIVAGILGAGAIGGGAYALWPASAPATKADAAVAKPDASPPPDAAAAKPDAAAKPPADAAVPADAGAAPDAGVTKPATTKKKPPPKKKPPIKKKKS